MSTEISYKFFESQIGSILIACQDNKICFLSFENDLNSLQRTFPKAKLKEAESNSLLKKSEEKINSFLSKKTTKIDLPLALIGTPFQTKVWNELLNIPHGETRSYSQIANDLGMPKSFRAVANAIGQNNISILIPCHRVLRKNNQLSGYRWGVERKAHLLNIENIA
jgi:AraC family transcriptional regulator of adaptative response/methylated-DNA-[protein]-cysteine methyltransferase